MNKVPVLRLTIFYNDDQTFTPQLEETAAAKTLNEQDKIDLLQMAVDNMKKQLKGTSK